jgi:hypothetical protein
VNQEADSRSALERRLDALHERARSSFLLQRLTVVTRILIAAGFIPTGLVKVLGERFTQISLDSPIGLFFEGLYRSGLYWRFLGLAQLVTGALLLIPATATVAAVSFFAIILNIFVITVSMEFRGTPVITGLMLLAAIYLLCWDYDRLKGLLFAPRRADVVAAPRGWRRLERTGYVLATVGSLLVLGATRSFVPRRGVLAGLGLGVVGGGALLVAWFLQSRAARGR